jgi:hypothetical protein
MADYAFGERLVAAWPLDDPTYLNLHDAGVFMRHP